MTKSADVVKIAQRMYDAGYQIQEITNMLKVSHSTIYRWRANLWNNNHVNSTARGHKLTFDQEHNLINRLCNDRPCMRQFDVAKISEKEFGISISQSYVSRMIARHSVTYKVATKRFDECNDELVRSFLSDLPIEAPFSWFALDECAFHLNYAPVRAYNKRGQQAIVSRPGSRGKRVSLLLCVAAHGCMGFQWIEGGVKAEDFQKFLASLPKDSVIVLDNASIHKASISLKLQKLLTVSEVARQHNQKLVYLPAYAPKLNPTEFCFNMLKSTIRRMCIRNIDALYKVTNDILENIDMQ